MRTENLSKLERHSATEEILSSVTHGIGAGLSTAALAILVTLAGLYGDVWRVVSFSIYGATLVLMYTASTCYHAFRTPELKRLFRILDHSAIYLLIAGTYTPFMLVTLRGAWGWSLFGVTWGIAVLGILMTVLSLDRFKLVNLLSYLAMGWLGMIAIRPLVIALPRGGVIWLVIGGVAYTLGVVFYAGKKIPFNHAIWHLFVLGGSICHFFALLFYVLPI